MPLGPFLQVVFLILLIWGLRECARQLDHRRELRREGQAPRTSAPWKSGRTPTQPRPKIETEIPAPSRGESSPCSDVPSSPRSRPARWP